MINFTQKNENASSGFRNNNISLKQIDYFGNEDQLCEVKDKDKIKKLLTTIDLMTKYFLTENSAKWNKRNKKFKECNTI